MAWGRTRSLRSCRAAHRRPSRPRWSDSRFRGAPQTALAQDRPQLAGTGPRTPEGFARLAEASRVRACSQPRDALGRFASQPAAGTAREVTELHCQTLPDLGEAQAGQLQRLVRPHQLFQRASSPPPVATTFWPSGEIRCQAS